MTYVPGNARMGEATPQSDPDMFTDAEILAEAKYLLRMHYRLGGDPQRTLAFQKLKNILREREGN